MEGVSLLSSGQEADRPYGEAGIPLHEEAEGLPIDCVDLGRGSVLATTAH